MTDIGLVHLGKLLNLEVIDLDGTSISDAGLAYLEPLKSLPSFSPKYHHNRCWASLSLGNARTEDSIH